MVFKPSNILLLPGWQNSGPRHWQSLWQARHGYRRVEQHDWLRPLRGDWTARLEETVVDADGPVLLGGHSLGCILAAWWAAHSANTHRVQGALLVAPGDVERADLAAQVHHWSPIVRQALPFHALLVASRNDPYCSWARAEGLAQSWGARFIDLGQRGHINAQAGLGDWRQGHDWLHQLPASAPADQRASPSVPSTPSVPCPAGRCATPKKAYSNGHEKTQGPGPRPCSPARPPGRRTGPGGRCRSARRAAIGRNRPRHVPATHAHGRGGFVRTGRVA